VSFEKIVKSLHNAFSTVNTKFEKLKPIISLQGTDKINKRLDVLDAKVNKLSDTVIDLRAVVEESRKNDTVGNGQPDMLAKEKMVDHPIIIDPSSLEICFIMMRQLDTNQKNSNIQIARFILCHFLFSLDHGICASPADVDKTVVAYSSQDTSSPLDD
ncbi:hypothetical protein H5410_062129, partial [Solanum commersonii]